MSWKPTDRSTTVDPSDLISATPNYGSDLRVSVAMFDFAEKVTIADVQDDGTEDASFLSYAFLATREDGSFDQKFSVTKFAKLWKIKGLIENGKIKSFIGQVVKGEVQFLAFTWKEFHEVFDKQTKKEKEPATA